VAVLADPIPESRTDGEVRVSRSGVDGKALKIEADRASVSKVLEAVAAATGARVHHSLPAAQKVTAVCEGPGVEAIMECLVGPEGSLVYRYPATQSASRLPRQPEEIWVIRKGAAIDPAGLAALGAGGKGVSDHGRNPVSGVASPTPPMDAKEAQRFVAMARDPAAGKRLDALSALAAQGNPDDSRVREIFESARGDADPDVRAQAVLGLSRLSDSGSDALLADAMRDEDASVRLMAVDVAGNDPQGVALLQQAVNDSDEAVRIYAEMKLERSASAAEGSAR
jgi:hypothetical protein